MCMYLAHRDEFIHSAELSGEAFLGCFLPKAFGLHFSVCPCVCSPPPPPILRDMHTGKGAFSWLPVLLSFCPPVFLFLRERVRYCTLTHTLPPAPPIGTFGPTPTLLKRKNLSTGKFQGSKYGTGNSCLGPYKPREIRSFISSHVLQLQIAFPKNTVGKTGFL